VKQGEARGGVTTRPSTVSPASLSWRDVIAEFPHYHGHELTFANE
jgi:hypothetical protein